MTNRADQESILTCLMQRHTRMQVFEVEGGMEVIAYNPHAFDKPPRPAAPPPTTASALKRIFALLRAQTGHDFSQYKPTTSQRRIQRRMALQQIDSTEARKLQEALQKANDRLRMADDPPTNQPRERRREKPYTA